MQVNMILCDDPWHDLTITDRETVRRELGNGWTDDLDFAVIVSASVYANAVSMAGLFRRQSIGSVYAVKLSPKRTLVLFTHA